MRNLYRTVLDNEESLARDVDQFLKYVDVAHENRRAELFKKWSDRVYTPLQVKNHHILSFQCTVMPLDALYFIILPCLTPDDLG